MYKLSLFTKPNRSPLIRLFDHNLNNLNTRLNQLLVVFQEFNMVEDYVFSLSQEDEKYVVEKLNETPETRRAALNTIKQWLAEVRPDLHARGENERILPFLRACKFDTERAKEKLINYYTMRRDRVEWFRNRDPTLPEIQELVNMGVFVPLRKLFENKLVVIIRTCAHDPSKHKINDVFKTGKMVLDIAALEEEKAQIYGVTAVFDMAGLSLAHAKQLNTTVIKNAVYAWQNYHCRPKQLEFVNAPVYVNVVLDVFRRFLSAKLRNRVRVHFGSMESLHQVVDKKILPPEYGGEGESMEELIKYWGQKLVDYKGWFADDEQYRAD